MIKAFVIAGMLLAAPVAAAAQNAGGLSEASQQVVKESFAKRSAELAPLIAKKRELQRQFDSLLTPASYDAEKLASTMSEMRAVEGEIVEKMGTSLLALLKSLPENDRAIFLKSLSKTPPTASAAVSGSKDETGQ